MTKDETTAMLNATIKLLEDVEEPVDDTVVMRLELVARNRFYRERDQHAARVRIRGIMPDDL